MAQKNISTPVVAAVIILVVLVVGVFLYKGVTGGTVGSGEPGKVMGAPPMPNGGSQEATRSMQTR